MEKIVKIINRILGCEDGQDFWYRSLEKKSMVTPYFSIKLLDYSSLYIEQATFNTISIRLWISTIGSYIYFSYSLNPTKDQEETNHRQLAKLINEIMESMDRGHKILEIEQAIKEDYEKNPGEY
jgi:hypothetical protein